MSVTPAAANSIVHPEIRTLSPEQRLWLNGLFAGRVRS